MLELLDSLLGHKTPLLQQRQMDVHCSFTRPRGGKVSRQIQLRIAQATMD